ncbi:hypothetical protein FNV43_RR05910 [Rhamnella rubrinervis]|uniref:Bromo domain-containing protein n=1 Tax=Rhamnella rubrinervis TaxID=2594499 RepID=A0A8K0HCG1_9ROSA|nr:hypothetical protein FNV43_RR05910 [Rhamnella rubrinervis]
MIATKSIMPSNKLKIKVKLPVPIKRIDAEPGTPSCDFGHRLLHSDDYTMAKVSDSGARKRGLTGIIEGHKEKRQKLDRNMTMQCSTILKKLMSHESAWVFNTPVDPVALNIPDYFSIITSPMDLGTIKSKLDKNMYSFTDEFAADVRLTFSNAMRYNPPANIVHKMAKKLNQIFEMRWKFVEEKCNRECSIVGSGKTSSGPMKLVIDVKQNNQNRLPTMGSSISVPKKSIPSEEKVIRCSFNATDAEVGHSKTAKHCTQKFLGRNLKTGNGSGGGGGSGGSSSSSSHSCCPVTKKLPSSSIAGKCGTCGNPACRCILSNVSTRVSSSEQPMGRDNHIYSADISKLACQAKSTPSCEMSKSDQDSDGAVSALDDVNICPSSQPTTPVTDNSYGEGLNTPLCDVQRSPKKALRAAMMMRRFAGTILKAQQNKLFDHGDKSDPIKIQQEKERLERRLQEDARLEAEIEAAKAALRKKAEMELKQQREREREAARAAIEKMERTVVIEQNWSEIEIELEKLMKGCDKRPLEMLGLFIRDEFSADDYDEVEAVLNDAREEGEIL